MTRKNGRKLPAYCEHKPSGRSYVRLTINGTRETIYLGPHNSQESLNKYDEVVGEWLATKEVGRRQSGPTVADIGEQYASHQEPLLDADKLYNVRNALKVLNSLFGDRPVAEFGPLQFDRFRDQLVKAGYSKAYGNRLLRIVKQLFKWALKRGVIDANRYAGLMAVDPLTSKEAPTKIVEPADDVDVDATLPLLSADFQDMIRFLRATGCRPGEARLMQVGDIDREHWLLHRDKHKTAHKGKSRIIPIPSSVQGLLLPRLLRPADAFVFGADDGERAYHKRALARAIDRAIVRINRERSEADLPTVDHWHPYRLRHLRATEVREQFGVEVAQVLLGHARIDMTQHYAGITEAKAKEVGKLIG
jgi:integrase